MSIWEYFEHVFILYNIPFNKCIIQLYKYYIESIVKRREYCVKWWLLVYIDNNEWGNK